MRSSVDFWYLRNRRAASARQSTVAAKCAADTNTLSDFAQSDHTGAVAVGLAGRVRGLGGARLLGGELLARGLAARGLARDLLGAGHATVGVTTLSERGASLGSS